jgi:Fe-S oxidoreductase
MSCCGLPATLVGDSEKSIELANILRKKVKDLGVKMIVTTCAGCTSNLNEIVERDEWNVPVYHILEYLSEVIGLDTLSREFIKKDTPATRVAVHDPCHLIRHTSRRIMEYAVSILETIPSVDVSKSAAHDSCCGGGGMVGRHSPDVARGVVRENVDAILETGAEKVVTPCPLCTAQLEENLFRHGSDIDVEDLTVLIARSLKGE